MRSIIIQPGQTLADIAIQWCGSLSAWPLIAALNGLGFTDLLTAGTSLLVPEATEKRTAQYFAQGGYITELEGIDYWYIELDFKVS
jgi:hypothetical protein